MHIDDENSEEIESPQPISFKDFVYPFTTRTAETHVISGFCPSFPHRGFYPKRDVWLIIYEFVASAWAELTIDGIPST
jgi:hypothetical protein